MSELVNYEYPPPRSWEQFEELCADLVEAMWSDPRVVRHGRAGQAQCGVDIIAARGGIYPVGLQCKKKSRWPAKTLTRKEVNQEISEAEKFRPALKELYILTTAVPDEALQKHVRTLNEARKKLKQFEVEILFWPEIVRRVARLDQVAMKHFPLRGGRGEFSPLLATWYTSGGSLELSGDDWHLAVAELGEDFHEWPTGRVIVRQRETDVTVAQLQKLAAGPASTQDRSNRLELRRKLRYAQAREHRVQDLIRMLYTNELLKFYMLELDESGMDANEILRSVIERELSPGLGSPDTEKIRLAPPTPHLLSGPLSRLSLAIDDVPVHIPGSEIMKIMRAEQDFPAKFYGNEMVKVVSELPQSVRRRYAIPAILNQIRRIMKEDHKSIQDMQTAGYFNLNEWSYKY
ncbi:hypothetical protein PIN31009_02339 [Pandoraea iniqua]|uniref:restriction endonuclease n=1 Tax=Pandoraea iniqua TaxID=2508288 RepID=UPI0012427411|nr:restriction endonuclease [Pandoraea iniqua]VVE05415.1 hypothetical protein PIN31009_02339 [Pandoraea iniqua]